MSPRQRKAPDPIRLDIACGQAKPDGWVGIDYAPGEGVDIHHDLFRYPWPLADNSVLEARCSHFVEHIPHWRPDWSMDGWWMFWQEVHRICAPDARIEVWHPYGRSDRAWWDPTHERAIVPETWYYLDGNWRAAQGLGHYPVTADFEVVVIDGQGVPDSIMARSDDYQAYARAHYHNVFADLHVVLRVRKPVE